MPVISGIEFLQSLQNPPLIIFTTAFSDYALKGYELDVVDYLLKPISYSRFYQAIEKVHARIDSKNDSLETNDKEHTYFFVKHDGKLLKIVFSEILYIKAEQEYSRIYTNEKELLVSMHLKLLENILPESTFTRIHRSYIIPQEIITSISGNTIQIGEAIRLPIGTKYKDNLIKKLKIR